MKNREKYKRLFRGLSSLIIVGVLTVAFAWVWYAYFADSETLLVKTFFRRGNYVLIALYGVITYLFYKAYGALKVGYMRTIEAAYTQVLAVLCTNAVTYLQLCLIGRWRFLENVQPILWLTLADVTVVIAWAIIARFLYTKLYPPRDVLVVYGPYDPTELIRKLASRKDKYVLRGAVSIGQGLEQVQEQALACGSVILMDLPAQERNLLLKFCFRHNIRCYCVPKISDIMLRRAEDIHLFDTSLILMRNLGLSAEQQCLKRVFDILLSLVALAAASPLMLLIAMAIKAYDRGPVLFTQERLTRDGKIFKLYKFRSMKVAGENEEYCMTKINDSRVTPVGKLLRNIHFDELPQLLNILKGDMSFVGPRPECPGLAEDYRRIIPEFDLRLKMKAGLTGYAQVYGKYNTTPLDKLKLDLEYIQNYSFLLDLKLILLTVKVLFQKENTEGIQDWQTNAATAENLEKLEREYSHE